MKKKKVIPTEYQNIFGIPELVTYSDCQTAQKPQRNFQEEPVFDIGYNADKKTNVFAYLEKRITNRFISPIYEDCGMEAVLANIHPDVSVKLTEIYQLPIKEKLSLLKTRTKKKMKHLLDEKEVDAALEEQLEANYDTVFDKIYWVKIFENGTIIFEAEAGNLRKKRYHMSKYNRKFFNRTHLRLCDLKMLLANIMMWSEVRKFLDRYQANEQEEREDNIPYRKYFQNRKELFTNGNSISGQNISFQQILDLYIFNAKALPLSLFLKEQQGVRKQDENDIHVRTKFSALTELFLLLAENYGEEKEDFKYEAATARTYAKSFQDKVVASNRLKREMQLSKLNQYFGKVEFDAMVDMHKIRGVERAFETLNAQVFREPRLSDYSIRFRRLGCHKVAGLYYPMYQCMCIDIEHPDSFCHEFFHLLDYKNGKLSKKWVFRDIYERYVSLIVERVNSDSSLKSLKNSNRKYNLSYYKRSTEVFARCGEIYISRILGIDNILINIDENDFAYPSDTELEKMIREYFDNMFNKERKENDNGKYHRESNSSETTELLFGEKIRC